MSADRKRLTSALRRIVKTDPEVRSLLKAAESKGGKPGAAGVGSSTEAQQARVCCDGSVGDENPGVEERDPDSGGQADGLNGSDPAKLDMGEGTLSGVTDCATGEPICFDGCGHLPPDGWDDPNDPPIDPEYVEGTYYKASITPEGGSTTTTYHQTCERAQDWLAESTGCPCGFDELFSIASSSPCAFGASGSFKCDGGAFCFSGSVSIDTLSCDTTYNAICDDPPPTAESWASDGCTNLAIVNGTIVGSKYDPENDGSYSAPRTSINLCDGAGNQISLAPSGSSDCGWKTLNSTNDSGYLYDSSGKVIAHIDGNEYSDPTM